MVFSVVPDEISILENYTASIRQNSPTFAIENPETKTKRDVKEEEGII